MFQTDKQFLKCSKMTRPVATTYYSGLLKDWLLMENTCIIIQACIFETQFNLLQMTLSLLGGENNKLSFIFPDVCYYVIQLSWI